MRTYSAPTIFDGSKFQARYTLQTHDYWITGGLIYVPDNLPDDPPIFEAPNPPIITNIFPSGAIITWVGNVSAGIPNGWAICDGTQGTPDLRDKTIKGII